MAEWLVEQGIGEHRAMLVEDDQVLAAKIYWPGEIVADSEYLAKLIAKGAGHRRGVAALENGTEVLVDHLPSALTEGATFTLRISRAPITERGRFKRAQGRYVETELSNHSTPVATEVFGVPDAKIIHQFPAGLWEDIWSASSSGSIAFTGGEILCSVTPAMTLIDVDCGRPEEAYYNSVPTIAGALRWFDLGGNIGIDFPTVTDKGDRKAVDNRLGEYLADWPHERTSMNGFGFVQIVARLKGPSLLHRFATSRVGMCARYALRIAERTQGTGPILLLTVHPALKAKLKPEWLEELARRTGREVRIEINPALALEAPSAQIMAS